jgi:membrane protein implicated in regulation of membrane protease activity
MTRLLGIFLLIAGIYLIGKNIIFATTYFSYYHLSSPAIGSALAIIASITILVFFSKRLRNLG